ncbi:hypothetical protein [Thalassoroseus pseudoceratinae]|uniref:hypothetical protein n=1 Tax=Thalassoroseus pseudoceratinae TaxID=2713176 RepID=UPI001422864D|nr:hypothetical protein [Thalassoroseus pseudoceratinae]
MLTDDIHQEFAEAIAPTLLQRWLAEQRTIEPLDESSRHQNHDLAENRRGSTSELPAQRDDGSQSKPSGKATNSQNS